MTSTTSQTRRLQRSEDRMIGGVAGGLAEYADVDVSLVRLGFIALTVFGGSGPLLYLAAWLVLPQTPVPAAPAPPPGPNPPPAPAPTPPPATSGPAA